MARGVGGHGPANIMKHLKGIDFLDDGVSKEDLVHHARQAPGPDTGEVVEFLEKIDGDKRYHSPADVMKQIGQAE